MNFGWLHSPPLPPACCHCLMVRSESGVVLVDTGIGMHDIADPGTRIGFDAIEAAGFRFLPDVTAIRQLALMNFSPKDVTDIVLTHCDPDHAGGLSDFPHARVHISAEEKRNLESGNPRYSLSQFSHAPNWVTYETDDSDLFGSPSRRLRLASDVEIRLVPLFGHTNGHCGVAIFEKGEWLLHVGDAYYLRDELTTDKHPIDELARMRADDNARRLESLNELRRLTARGVFALTHFGYHDSHELPNDIPRLEVFE